MGEIHTKKSKMRRAKRRTLNKRKNAHKNSQSLISHYPLQSTVQRCITRTRDQQNRYDDRLRIQYFGVQKPNDHFVPRWIIITTSNYLHAGGWTTFINRQSFYNSLLPYIEYFSLFQSIII